MRSLLDLISNHSDANSIIPIIAIASIVVTIIIYVLLKPKWIKYIASIIIIVVGGVMFYNGYENMLTQQGLNLIIDATKVLVFGITMFLFSLILDILDSLAKIFKRNNRHNNKRETTRNDRVVNETNRLTKDETIIIKDRKKDKNLESVKDYKKTKRPKNIRK